MATDVILPALGMAQDTGKIVEWLKAEGEAVTAGEPLVVVETDKAAVDLEAPATGILSRVTAQVGDEVPVGQVIAVILAPGEALSPIPGLRPAAAPLAPARSHAIWQRQYNIAGTLHQPSSTAGHAVDAMLCPWSHVLDIR